MLDERNLKNGKGHLYFNMRKQIYFKNAMNCIVGNTMNNENSIPVKIQVTFFTQKGPLYWSRGGVAQSTALIRVLK